MECCGVRVPDPLYVLVINPVKRGDKMITTVGDLITRLQTEDRNAHVALAIKDESNDYTLYGNLSPGTAVIIKSNSEILTGLKITHEVL